MEVMNVLTEYDSEHCLEESKTLTEQSRDCEGVYIEGNKVKSYNNQK